jgi:thioredoxin-related protein
MPSYYKSRFSSRASNLSSRASNPETPSSGFWILIIVFIVLIIISVMTGSFYKKYERFTNPDISTERKIYTLQYYCMKQCGHCNRFEETVWKDYSEKINSNPLLYKFNTVKYDIMDSGIGQEMGVKYNITSTPTILLYNDSSKKVIPFMDERTEAKLTAFANDLIKKENPTWLFT